MTRLVHAWGAMSRERQIALVSALGLFVSMFLPWYSKTVIEGTKAAQTSQSAFSAFSFVELAVLLVSAGVLAMLFSRAEGREFRLPGGDGTIVMIAGGWAALLIFYRMLDKPTLQGTQKITATVGVEWGIFIALLLALGLLAAGRRIRAAEHAQSPPARRRPRAARHSAEPSRDRDERPTPAEERPREERRPSEPESAAEPSSAPTTVLADPEARPRPSQPRSRPRFPPRPDEPEQLSFEDPPAGG
ncbi:MAG TPA: hypothetical protein VH061_06400 [Solirubrobacteraceae bacterium]|jgi:hypothetical protein|nr:hypothetical protein [Solirubrobacteraceae bacterium]